MRWAILAALLAGCGGSSKSSSNSSQAAPAPAPEVVRLNISDSPGTMTIDADYSTGTSIEDPYDLVVSLSEGSTAPEKCDASSKEGVVLQFTGLKAATLYSLRACVFTSTAASYSAGIVTQHTTP